MQYLVVVKMIPNIMSVYAVTDTGSEHVSGVGGRGGGGQCPAAG